MKVYGVSVKQRKLIIYEHLDDDSVKYYDGKSYHETTKEIIHEYAFTKSRTSKYIPIKKDEYVKDNNHHLLSLESNTMIKILKLRY